MNMKELREKIFKFAYKKYLEGDSSHNYQDAVKYLEGRCEGVPPTINVLKDAKVLTDGSNPGEFRISIQGILVYEKHHGRLQPYLDKMLEDSTKVYINNSTLGDGNILGSSVEGDVSTTKFDVDVVIEQAINAIEQADIPEEEKSRLKDFVTGTGKTVVEKVLGPMAWSFFKQFLKEHGVELPG